jgi:hypothetical protein
VIAEGELAGIVVLGVGIPAGIRAAAGRNLGYAQCVGLAAHFGAFARGENDAGVGNGETQDGDDLAEILIGDRLGRVTGQLGSGGWFEAGNADGMGPDAEGFSEMLDVLHEGQDFKAPIGQTEEHADPDVVNAGFMARSMAVMRQS